MGITKSVLNSVDIIYFDDTSISELKLPWNYSKICSQCYTGDKSAQWPSGGEGPLYTNLLFVSL